MKSVLSLTLIVCLVGSTLPLAAQEPTAGPIARAQGETVRPGPVDRRGPDWGGALNGIYQQAYGRAPTPQEIADHNETFSRGARRA